MRDTYVTVVIVSYKSAALTIDCLKSISLERNMDDIHINVVVVDNASGDTPAIEEAVHNNYWTDWVVVITAPRNGGFAYGNNLAFHYVLLDKKVDFFHLLNPDTVIRPGAIIELVKFMKSCPDAGIAGSSFENIDGSLWPIAFRFPSLLGELVSGIQISFISKLLHPWVVPVSMEQKLQTIDWVAGASMMLRRSTVENLRGFDEGYFLYYEETDLCLRAKRAGFSTWYVPTSRVMHIAGQSTKVTERDAKPKRLPDYWFESRRRYFVNNHGIPYAILADIIAIFANALGKLKRVLVRKHHEDIPHLLTDLIKQCVLFTVKRNSSDKFFSALPPLN